MQFLPLPPDSTLFLLSQTQFLVKVLRVLLESELNELHPAAVLPPSHLPPSSPYPIHLRSLFSPPILAGLLISAPRWLDCGQYASFPFDQNQFSDSWKGKGAGLLSLRHWESYSHLAPE